MQILNNAIVTDTPEGRALLSKRCSELRKKSGLKTDVIADKIHVSVGRVGAWCKPSNDRIPNPFLLRDFCAALGLGGWAARYSYIMTGSYNDPITEYIENLSTPTETRAALGMMITMQDYLMSFPSDELAVTTVVERDAQTKASSQRLALLIGERIDQIAELTGKKPLTVKRWGSKSHASFPNVFELHKICEHLEGSFLDILGKYSGQNDIKAYLEKSDPKDVRKVKEGISILTNTVFT